MVAWNFELVRAGFMVAVGSCTSPWKLPPPRKSNEAVQAPVKDPERAALPPARPRLPPSKEPWRSSDEKRPPKALSAELLLIDRCSLVRPCSSPKGNRSRRDKGNKNRADEKSY
jgi:hypothetical protein